MRAPVFKGVGKPLQVETLPDPTPQAGDLVLKIARCGICGTDLHMTDGHAQTFPVDTVIGHEFAGEVVAIGSEVAGFKVGDRVTAMPVVGCGRCASCLQGETAWCTAGLIGLTGGYGQYAPTKAHAAMRLPASLSMTDGALIEPLAVALHGVALAQLEPGCRVLVLGAGPIGLGAVYWARLLGGGRIAAMSRSRRGEELALELGASCFVQSGEGAEAALKGALGGPPDVVFECIGQPGMLTQAMHLVRPRGTVVILGNCMLPDTVYPSLAMFKQLRIQGSMVYSLREFQAVADVLDAGHLEPRAMVTDTVSYAQLPQVFESLRHPLNQCKVMIDPWKAFA
ncbi:MAG: alcohol dehydrogenase catalytic domain-containing protein [Steroidobacteraceae bacterium]